MSSRRWLVSMWSAVALAVLCTAAWAADYVWWEGENAVEHNFKRGAFAARTLDHPEQLSGGAWLDNGGVRKGPEIFARWNVRVPKTGRYYFYARKFWHHGPFRWRFDSGPWHEARRLGLMDNVSMARFICANWVGLGQVDLTAGEHRFEIRLLAKEGENAAAAFDCFLLSPSPFIPYGKLKPGEKSGDAMPGFWAFAPGQDPFKESPIDLRRLNDRTAGDRGFLKRRGLDVVFEKEGKPVRFWGVNVGQDVVQMDRASVDYLARMLAKHGVNIVRVHAGVWDRKAADPASIDTAYLDKLHYFEAAMKKQGIYTHLSFYFVLWFNVRPEFGLPGYEKLKNKRPFALLYFYPRMQQIYRSWARGLLTSKNPYTGLSFADDPAVAMVEINNEDNYFFWTFKPGETIPFECLQVLEKKFGDWAARKYGSLQKAFDAWGYKNKRDDLATGRAGLLGAWFMTGQGLKQNPGTRRRVADQVRFLTEDLRAFYEGMSRWFRQELGVKVPIIATNWRIADGALLGALDKYTNMACDVMDRHEYTGSWHATTRGYTVSKGDCYADRCIMYRPAPVRELQYDGHPSSVSEYSFPMINRYRSDAPFLAAVYGALQGTDFYFFFAVKGAGWLEQLTKWPLMTPVTLGQFPACALLYRRGDIEEAPTVIHQVLSLKKLYDLEGSGTAEPEGIDSLRAKEIPPGGKATGVEVSNIDPLAYYVGRVVRSFGEERKAALLTDLTPYIDRKAKVVRSLRGEAMWDWGKCYATVNVPRAQGATGMLGAAGEIRLRDVTVKSGNDYGCVLVVSLTDEPLVASRKVLVQAMTDELTYGWKTKPITDPQHGKGLELLDIGVPPLNVRNIAGTVTLRRPDAARLTVTALDGNGYPMKRKVAVEAVGDGLTITLEPDVLYYVIERR